MVDEIRLADVLADLQSVLARYRAEFHLPALEIMLGKVKAESMLAARRERNNDQHG